MLFRSPLSLVVSSVLTTSERGDAGAGEDKASTSETADVATADLAAAAGATAAVADTIAPTLSPAEQLQLLNRIIDTLSAKPKVQTVGKAATAATAKQSKAKENATSAQTTKAAKTAKASKVSSQKPEEPLVDALGNPIDTSVLTGVSTVAGVKALLAQDQAEAASKKASKLSKDKVSKAKSKTANNVTASATAGAAAAVAASAANAAASAASVASADGAATTSGASADATVGGSADTPLSVGGSSVVLVTYPYTPSEQSALLRASIAHEAVDEAAYATNLFFVNQLRNFKNEAMGTANKISCELMLRGLAQLRAKSVPSVFELIDAAKSSFIKEELVENNYLIKQLMRKLSSVQLGYVPMTVGVPPIWRDFITQAQTFGVSTEDSEPHEVHIDIHKNTKMLEKSRFFSRMAFLSPAFCPPNSAGSNSGYNYIKRTETFVYTYNDLAVMQIIAASEHGDTIVQACGVLLKAKLQQKVLPLAELSELYRQCVNMGIEEQYAELSSLINQAIAQERSFMAISAALTTLNSYVFIAKLTKDNEPVLASLKEQVIERGCVLLLQQNDVVTDELDDFIEALISFDYYVRQAGSYVTSFYEQLQELLNDNEVGASLQGAYLALLFKNKQLSYEDFVTQVDHFVYGSITTNNKSVDFFYSLLKISKAAIFYRGGILQIINDYIERVQGEEFFKVLVMLKRAFVGFSEVELYKLVRMLKKILGIDITSLKYEASPQEFAVNRAADRMVAATLSQYFAPVGAGGANTGAESANAGAGDADAMAGATDTGASGAHADVSGADAMSGAVDAMSGGAHE